MNINLKPSTFSRLLAVTIASFACASCQAQENKSVIHDGDRIVFVGDSITGQGGNAGEGWTNLMKAALAETHPNGAPTLIPLGGSGQTVGSWQSVERESRQKAVTLDVKGIDVKETLDKPADVVVIMLGMNDVLSPSLDGSPADFDAWATRYRQLIASIKERTKPRLFAFATVPLCTEDENSPKNQAIADLTERLKTIAKEENGIVLPVHDTMLQMLGQGRTLRPDFHVTNDFVHPNFAGHLAIALGMLNGLGESEAAQDLNKKYGDTAWGQAPNTLPALSYAVEYLPAPLDKDEQSCKIRYWWTAALPGQTTASAKLKVSLTVPNGWRVTPKNLDKTTGEFTVTGNFENLKNKLALEATVGTQTYKTEVVLPAPWLVGTANYRQFVWQDGNSRFDPAKGHLAIDDTLIAGKGWGKPAELEAGHPIKWVRYNPTVNYIGGNQPGSVDMSAVTFFNSFEVGYGARWIYSDKDRTVQFKLGSGSFGGNDYLALWMNGESIYGGHIMGEQGKVVDAKLKKGWNAMVFKSNHLQWQWHFYADLVETDDTKDLKFSIVPHE